MVFMKTKILLLMAKETFTQALASSEVEKNIAMHWNINNNCGRRPQGLRYPLPDNSTGNYLDNIECDIMENTRYISGYQCIAPCQSDPAQTAHLVCNCHMEMGPIHFIKQCEWEYKGPSCPVLTEDDKRYDWECHPKNQNCPADQYTSVTTSKAAEPTEMTTFEFTVTNYLDNFETGEVTEGDIRSLEATDAHLTSRHRTNPKFSNLEKIKNSQQGHAKVNPGHLRRRWSNGRPAESNSVSPNSNYNDVQLLKWAMNNENSEIGAPRTTIKSTTVTTQYMLNDIQYESEPKDNENPQNFDFEDVYEQEFLQDDWAMMRPIQNIVNFYNGPGKQQNPKINNYDVAPRSYPLNSQMMNDARATSYSSSSEIREEPQENFQMLDAKLHKRLGKFKAEVEMLRLKLAEQEAKHEALKQFVAKNLKIDVDPELLGEIKKKK